jgi:hypothetical protein
VLLSGSLEFAVYVSEVLLPGVRLLELLNQAGNVDHGTAGGIKLMHTFWFYLIQQMKLENYWQGEQAKCL